MQLPVTRLPYGHELMPMLALVPGAWRDRVERVYRKKASGDRDAMRAGAEWLNAAVSRIGALKVPATLTDSELVALAKEKAAQCLAFAFTIHDKRTLRERMAGYVETFGIEAPPVVINWTTGELGAKHVTDDGAIKRMTCKKWWARALRRSQARAIEAEAIRLGYVHRQAEIYASDVAVLARAQQKRRNAAGLEATMARNVDTGQEFTLAELAARSVANPVIRRGELMTRIAGFEAVAKGVGDIGVFVTVTCPSRMHPHKTAKSKAGKVSVWENPKYDGTTPREAQGYLSKMWAKVRAALHRKKIMPYGFRIAEPHHDATPHWHLLLFVAAEMKAAFCRIFCKYARQADAGELGSKQAKAARFLVKIIDPQKGSAAGYIAKYVSKNIDGYQVQQDLEAGRDAVTGSQRVEAWAARWGIRQFQQIGGAPVGVWRELRRMDAKQDSDRVEAARLAAGVVGDEENEPDYGKYFLLMGGPGTKRKDFPLSVAKTRAGHRWNYAEGCDMPAPLTTYGEESKPAPYGVLCVESRRAFPSRRYQWEVKRRAGVAFELKPLAAPWSPVNNCTGVEDGREGGEVGREAGRGEERPAITAFADQDAAIDRRYRSFLERGGNREGEY